MNRPGFSPAYQPGAFRPMGPGGAAGDAAFKRSSLTGYDRSIIVIVTAAIMLEWSTTYFFNLDPEVFSFSKFVVLPLILLDFIIRYQRYLTRECITYGSMLAVGFALVSLAPVGESFYDDYVILAAVKLMPNIFVLSFYVACTREEEVLLILRTAFLSSLVVVACMLLANVGILAPVDYISEGNVTRITAGTSWSSLPLFLTFPSATLGGLLLRNSRSQLRLPTIIFAVGICFASFFAALLSGQRTSAALIIICLGAAALLYLSKLNWKNYVVIVLALLVGMAILLQFGQQFSIVGQTLLNRTTYSSAADVTGDTSDRILMYQTFFDALLHNPSFKPPGVGFFIQQNGNIPHLILGEAYCYGGLGLLAVIAYMFGRAWINIVKGWERRRKLDSEQTQLVLLIILLGFSLTLSFHPGLHTRMVYLVLGLCLARYSELVATRPNPRRNGNLR